MPPRARKGGRQDEAESEFLPNSGVGTVRCICGAQDKLRQASRKNARFAGATETARSWLIQCVGCQIWQHRSCVGTTNGNDPPGGYHCERCRKVNPVDGLRNDKKRADLLQKEKDQATEIGKEVKTAPRDLSNPSTGAGHSLWNCCHCGHVNHHFLTPRNCGSCNHTRCFDGCVSYPN